jgi:hypothetical protein
MGKQESDRINNKQLALIGYLVLCVSMVLMTLLLALLPQEQVVTPTAVQATRTLSPFVLTQQSDYAPVSTPVTAHTPEPSATGTSHGGN